MTAAQLRTDGRQMLTSQPRPDLQGMRAIAVLTVFADHLFGWPTGGFIGVDVFFVLSGFFITGILIRERTNTGQLSFENFYIRRIKRILPSALLVLAVTCLVGWIVFPGSRAKETLIDALYAAIFASNFRFQAVDADHFQRDLPPSPIQHYWSLSIEEQFYFAWPLLLVAVFAITRNKARRGRQHWRDWGLFGCMLFVVLSSFSWASYISAVDPNTAFFSTFARVWELGIGALLAIAGRWLSAMPSAIRPWLAYLGLAGVLASLLFINADMIWPAPWAALPVLSTALVVASFHGAQVSGMRILTNPVARYIGDISYTLYLWHWPVLILLSAIIPRSVSFYTITIGLSLALTAATYHLYEDPIRKSTWLLDMPTRGKRQPFISRPVWAFVGCLMAAAVVLTILGIRFTDRVYVASHEASESYLQVTAPPPISPPLSASEFAFTPQIAPLSEANPCHGAPAILDPDCSLRDPAVPLQPSIDTFSEDSGVPKCWTVKNEPLNSCTFGYRGDDAVRIAIIGDSHAARVLVAVAPYLESMKWQLTTYLGWGCAWSIPAGDECIDTMGVIQNLLLERRHDVVLTTASREWGTVDDYLRAWEPISAAGSKIVVVADNPAVSSESLECLTRYTIGTDRTGECGTPRREALQPRDPLIGAASKLPNTTLIDLTPYYCNDDICPSVIGDVIVYGDAGAHVTASYIKTLAPGIVSGIQRALLQ